MDAKSLPAKRRDFQNLARRGTPPASSPLATRVEGYDKYRRTRKDHDFRTWPQVIRKFWGGIRIDGFLKCNKPCAR